MTVRMAEDEKVTAPKVLVDAADDKPKPASQQCKAIIFEPRGLTGHSNCRRVRFAMSLFSPFMLLSAAGTSRDIYIEKFGAHATTMGVLWTVISYFGVFAGLAGGAVQDMQLLSRCFPLSSWGRRAPFFLVHLIVGSLAASCLYIPDVFSKDSGFLYVWFLLVMMVVFGNIGPAITAFECARQEIYPYKEERIIVEGFTKYSAMSGGGSGGLPFLLFSAVSGIGIRVGFSVCYILPLGLLSLEAVPVMREANAAATEAGASLGAICRVLLEAMPCRTDANLAMQHLMAMAWWDGAYGAVISGHLFYYITYVLKPASAVERTGTVIMAGATAGLTESLLNLVYMSTFGGGDARKDKSGKSDARLLHFVVWCRVLNALSTVLIIGVLRPSALMLCIWAFTSRCGSCGFTFWRISAKCWLVDEDCLKEEGTSPDSSPASAVVSQAASTGSHRRHREGTIFGAVALMRNFAGATFSSLALMGLGLAGLDTVNCGDRCEHLDGDLKSSCEEDCFTEVVQGQPESLRLYCLIMIGFVAPVFELLISLHAFWFPIKGVRLRRLYYAVMEGKGDRSYVPEAGPNPKVHEEIVLEVAAEKAASIMVLGPHRPDVVRSSTWKETLDITIAAVSKRIRPSCAVVFDLTDTGNEEEKASQGNPVLAESTPMGIAGSQSNPVLAESTPRGFTDEAAEEDAGRCAEFSVKPQDDTVEFPPSEKVVAQVSNGASREPTESSGVLCQMCLPKYVDRQPSVWPCPGATATPREAELA